jgi:hypothetical protein
MTTEKLILCNWCGKRHVAPAQNAKEALDTCLKTEIDRIIREQTIFAPDWKTLATGLVLGVIGMWIFPLVTGMGCIQ